MENKIPPALLAIALVLFTGCASIVSKSNWPVNITSEPSGASVVVKDSKGTEVFAGTTPTSVTLSSKKAYFRGESYTLEFSNGGHETKTYTLKSSLNGWYFGNLLFGGVIGFLIVDPLTGAMYRLDENVAVAFGEQLRFEGTEGALHIVSLDKLPDELKSNIAKISM